MENRSWTKQGALEAAHWPMQELRSDICIFIISPRRQAGGEREKREAKKDSKKLGIID